MATDGMIGDSGVYELLGALPAAILVVDSEARYTFANPAACALLGRPLEDVLGLTINDVGAGDIDVNEAWSSFAKTGYQHGEFSVLRPDGTTVRVQFSAARDFRPGLHVSVLQEMPERMRIEEQLRRNEEIYTKAFIVSPAPTNIRKLETGVFVDVNEAFTQVLGYWRADVLGRTGITLGLWRDPEVLEASLNRLRGDEPSVSVRAELWTKAREARDFAVSFRRVDIFQEPHVVAVFNDIASL